MTYIPLTLKRQTLTLPREWADSFKSDEVVATMFGDVLLVRSIPTVRYSKAAERKALKAIAIADAEEKAGKLKKLEGSLSDLLN